MISRFGNYQNWVRSAECRSVEDAEPAENRWQASAEQAMEIARQTIVRYPAACLGAAVALGILFGWWVKRK